MMLTGAPVDSGMFWKDGSLWFWPPTSGPSPSHTSLEHPSCWAPISWLPVIFLLPPNVGAETISRWPGPPCLQEGMEQTLDSLGHEGTEPPCDWNSPSPGMRGLEASKELSLSFAVIFPMHVGLGAVPGTQRAGTGKRPESLGRFRAKNRKGFFSISTI